MQKTNYFSQKYAFKNGHCSEKLPEWENWVSCLSPGAGSPQKPAGISWVWEAQEAEERVEKRLDEPLKSVPKNDHLRFLLKSLI